MSNIERGIYNEAYRTILGYSTNILLMSVLDVYSQ